MKRPWSTGSLGFSPNSRSWHMGIGQPISLDRTGHTFKPRLDLQFSSLLSLFLKVHGPDPHLKTLSASIHSITPTFIIFSSNFPFLSESSKTWSFWSLLLKLFYWYYASDRLIEDQFHQIENQPSKLQKLFKARIWTKISEPMNMCQNFAALMKVIRMNICRSLSWSTHS